MYPGSSANIKNNGKDLKKTILFLCTHNSARSQIAEGLVNSFFYEKYKAYSAGTEPGKVNPFAIKALSEIGVDISSHYSKPIDEFNDKHFNYVVTVCDKAKESCPAYLNTDEFIHEGFEDPSSFEGSNDLKLEKFKEVRDSIRNWLECSFP